MEINKNIHNTWKEINAIRKRGYKVRYPVGKYRYVYESKKGKISLVCLKHYFGSKNVWEIFSLVGNLFDDVERFKTRKNAEKRIKELLD